jgi:hypothetical protein
MRPILAFRIQERAHGGLSTETKDRLRQVMGSLEPQRRSPKEARNRFKPGTRLIREWREKTHEVILTGDGYDYLGKRYKSLSPIACDITGTHWSGPAFFGTKKKEPKSEPSSLDYSLCCLHPQVFRRRSRTIFQLAACSTGGLRSLGATLTKHFDDSSAIRRQLEWSRDYRRRCADCIVFLENIELIAVAQSPVRTIRCTERGIRFMREALKKADEIGVLTRSLTKAHRIVEHHGLELL